MNNQNGGNNTDNDKIEIVDINLLNPFKTNVNSDQILSTTNINSGQNYNKSMTNDINENSINAMHVQDNTNNQNAIDRTMFSSNIQDGNNATNLLIKANNDGNNNVSVGNNFNKNMNVTSYSTGVANDNISHNIPTSVNTQSMNSNIANSNVPTQQSSSLFLILAIASIFCFFTTGIFTIIGVVLCIISLIGSIVMLKKKAKLSVISLTVSILVFFIYTLSFVLAFKGVSSLVNETRGSSFKSSAHNFIMQTYQDVVLNEKVTCDNNDVKSIKEPLLQLAYENTVSPFGGNYDYKESYVLVEANKVNGICKYKMSIYLTDGTYSIGTPSNPVAENDIDSTDIIKN